MINRYTELNCSDDIVVLKMLEKRSLSHGKSRCARHCTGNKPTREISNVWGAGYKSGDVSPAVKNERHPFGPYQRSGRGLRDGNVIYNPAAAIPSSRRPAVYLGRPDRRRVGVCWRPSALFDGKSSPKRPRPGLVLLRSDPAE